MRKILIISILALCAAAFLTSTPSYAQISEKTGLAAAEIAEGDAVHHARPVLLKKYNSPERRKEAAKEQQDSTKRPVTTKMDRGMAPRASQATPPLPSE